MISTSSIVKIRKEYIALLGFPSELVKVEKYVSGTSFFPGGDGIWKESLIYRKNEKKVFVIGNTFDSVFRYKTTLLNDSENLGYPTWRNLIKILKNSNISLNEVYFTNLYPGLIRSNSNVGVLKSVNEEQNKMFIKFLSIQIKNIRPHLIIILGINVAKVLSKYMIGLPVLKNKTLKLADSLGHSYGSDLIISEIEKPLNWAIINHPSFSLLNSPRRIVMGMNGHEAEINLLRTMYNK